MQDKAARRLYRQEVGQKRAAQEIDAHGARRDVDPAGRGVDLEDLIATRIGAAAKRRRHAIGKSCRIAQAEIQALRADRRQDVGRLADKRRTPSPKLLGAEDGQGE